MKTLALVLLTIACHAQQYVVKVDDPKARLIIEQFTEEHCKPHAVKFVQDGNGDWITAIENFQNARFTFDKVSPTETKASMETKIDAEVKKDPDLKIPVATNITDLLNYYGVVIEYVPVVDSAEVVK